MKKLIALVAIASVAINTKAQLWEDLSFGAQLGTGRTLVSVDDPSPVQYGALSEDGTTTSAGTTSGRAIRLMAHYNLSESIAISSGFHFTYRRLWIQNTIGTYVGASVYSANYAQLPLLVRYTTNEVADQLNIIISAGPMFDMKIGETVDGADYAHFMNLADNNGSYDNGKSNNGNGTATSLFKGSGLSIFFGAGAQYRFSDTFNVYAGLSYQHALYNMLNPGLAYNNAEKTPISDTMTWKSNMLMLDIGVGFTIDK